MKRKVHRFIMIECAVIGMVMATWALWPRDEAVEQVRWGRDINYQTWHDEKQVQEGARLARADRIVAQQMLLEKSREEVVAMLGAPSSTRYFQPWDLVYWLGPERGYMSIDSEWLVIRLDNVGKVSEFRIVRD